jgi:hypothetical protein
MKKIAILSAVLLSACNSINIKPHTLDKSQLVYADRGGYSMKFAVKKELEDRGYKIIVGKAKNTIASDDFANIVAADTMNAKYIVKVSEKDPSFSPVVCLLGGFYWWRFNVSISDQKTGEELLAWTGRGCANGALRRLRRLMSELEKQ